MEIVDLELLLDVETYFVERDEFEHFNALEETFDPTERFSSDEEDDYYIATYLE